MLLAVLISIMLQFSQTENVGFTLINNTADVLQLEIEGFRKFSLPSHGISEFRLQAGQEIYFWKDVDGDGKDDRMKLLTVDPAMEGHTIKADKPIRESTQAFITQG